MNGLPRNEIIIPSASAMEAWGQRLGSFLKMGDLVLLNGELGAGKTTLARGIGVALGARGQITSPTFVLAREHPTTDGVPFVHVDAYRVAGAMELADLDIDFTGSITVVEWAGEMLTGVTDSWLCVDIFREIGGDPEDFAADSPRTIRLSSSGSRWESAAKELTNI